MILQEEIEHDDEGYYWKYSELNKFTVFYNYIILLVPLYLSNFVRLTIGWM